MKGYPDKSGFYLVKMREWNGLTRQWDVRNNEWRMVEIDTSRVPERQVKYDGYDELDDVRYIYEYEEVDKP